MECREWIDGHVHVIGGGIPEVEQLAGIERQYGYTHSNFLSVEGMGDAAQNALAIYYKLIDHRHYAFGGLHYRFSYDFAAEAAKLWEIGLDGMKMIENKPTERIKLGYAQDDVRYNKFYQTIEESSIPLLIHVNDPKEFWQKDQIPEWAVHAGYFYGDGNYPSYGQILAETLGMLKKYPKLKVCFAHFLFLADDLEKLSEIMDTYPNVWLDITAGTEMYFSFTEMHQSARKFFLKYQDRILYGTDNCNPATEEESKNMDITNHMEKEALRTAGMVDVWDSQVRGLGLPKETIQKITVDNFRAFAGEAPRPVNRHAAAAYLYDRLANPAYRLSRREQEIIREVYLNCV